MKTLGIERVLCGLVAGLAAGCSSLDSGEQTYCNSVGVDSSACQGQVSSGIGAGWWCMDREPPMLREPKPPTQPVGFVMPVVEWGALTPMAGRGLQTSLCLVTDFRCQNPLIPVYTVTDGPFANMPLPAGAAGFPVIEGFNGFLKFQVQTMPGTPDPDQYVPQTYYLGGPVSGDVTRGPPILMVKNRDRDTIFQQSFRGMVDASIVQTTGAVVVNVGDCDGNPVNNARVEINIKNDLIPFQLPASRIPIAQPPNGDGSVGTGPSGAVGYLKVPEGAVQVRAFRSDMTEIGSAQLGVEPGEISVVSIRPPYLNDANVVGVPIDDGQRRQ